MRVDFGAKWVEQMRRGVFWSPTVQFLPRCPQPGKHRSTSRRSSDLNPGLVRDGKLILFSDGKGTLVTAIEDDV